MYLSIITEHKNRLKYFKDYQVLLYPHETKYSSKFVSQKIQTFNCNLKSIHIDKKYFRNFLRHKYEVHYTMFDIIVPYLFNRTKSTY